MERSYPQDQPGPLMRVSEKRRGNLIPVRCLKGRGERPTSACWQQVWEEKWKLQQKVAKSLHSFWSLLFSAIWVSSVLFEIWYTIMVKLHDLVIQVRRYQLKMSLSSRPVNSFCHVPSIHLFYRACVFTSVIFQSCFFFLSAVHLSSVARPKPIFASSWWQRGGDCQGGGPCVLGKRRYCDFHKAVAALWGQISRSCRAVWLICVYRKCAMQKRLQKHFLSVKFALNFILSSIHLLACQFL